jgi:CheY-like chemotaxis protein
MVRILVVDDDASARELMRLHLEARGHSVALAGHGAQALQLLERRTAHEHHAWHERSAPVDVIVSDVEMPVMDGLELLEAPRAHAEAADIPVIFVTARRGAAVLDAAAACAVPVLSKPVDIHALARQIELVTLGRSDRGGIHAGEPPSLNAG